MWQLNLGNIEDIIKKEDLKSINGKPIDKKLLDKCLAWLNNDRGNHATTEKKVKSLLNSSNVTSIFDATSISSIFNIFHSYQLSGRSGVVTKSGENSTLIPGEAPIFARTMINHRSVSKRIDLNNLEWTSLFISPSISKSGFFALNLDRGLDSNQRPSNYERIYFEVPPDSEFEHLKEIIQTLFERYCNTLPPTVEAPTQELWLEAIENGRTYSYNDFSDYHSDLSSALQHFAILPPHWVERSTILEYNPEIKPSNSSTESPLCPPSNLSKLVNFQKRFATLSSYPLKEAKNILAKVEWFKSSSEGQDNSTLIAEYKRNQVDEALAKYIASSSEDYDTKKVIAYYHREALERRVSPQILLELDKMHNLYMNSDNWKHYTKLALYITLENIRYEGCGRGALNHLNNIIPLESNQVISQISGLKCWDKTAQSMISERHDAINWYVNQNTMITELNDLKSNIASKKRVINVCEKNAIDLHNYLCERERLIRKIQTLTSSKEIISRGKKQLQAAMADLKQPMQNERKLRKLDIRIVIKKIYLESKPRKFKIRTNKLESFNIGTQIRLKLMKAMLEEYDKLSVRVTKTIETMELTRRENASLDPRFMSYPLSECKDLFRSQTQANIQIGEEIKKMELLMIDKDLALAKHEKLKPRD